MKTVWIVQSYVPRHRVPLFEQLIAQLATHGVQVRVASGSAADANQADRGDEVRPGWLERIAWTRIGPAQISHARKFYRGADAVIFPHEGSNLELSAALLARIVGGATRVGVWGHLRSYVSDSNPFDAAIERWQLRRADRIFAYTATGASFAREAGAAADKIVTLNNTIDTDELSSEIKALDADTVQAFQARFNLVPARTIAYVGGIDESKRIDMLAETLDQLWETQPSVKLIVGGQGRSAGLLDRAVARGQVVQVGYADAKMKALIAATAQFIVNPGRVGLLAVDALAMGLPIVTTNWRYHAPEIEYLTTGKTVFTSADDTRSFARLVSDLLTGDLLPAATDKTQFEIPALSDMVTRYSDGIIAMLSGA